MVHIIWTYDMQAGVGRFGNEKEFYFIMRLSYHILVTFEMIMPFEFHEISEFQIRIYIKC